MVTEPFTDNDAGHENGDNDAGHENGNRQYIPQVPKRWPRWMSRFILELAQRGIVGHACDAAGVSKETVYKYRRNPKWRAFRAMWDEAIETAYDRLEQVAIDRATNPADPGFDPSPSAGLLKWLLEAYRPSKFKREKGVQVGPVYILQVGDYPQRQLRSMEDLDDLTDAELEALAKGDITLEEGDYTVLNKEAETDDA